MSRVRDRFLQCRVDAATFDQVIKLADADGRTVSEWLRDAVHRQLADFALIDTIGRLSEEIRRLQNRRHASGCHCNRCIGAPAGLPSEEPIYEEGA